MPDDFGAALNIVTHLAVCETYDPIAFAFQPSLALGVARRHLGQAFMDAAIHLDHQPLCVACEVSEIPADRRLPPEVRIELPELGPEPLFRPRHPPAQTSGAGGRSRGKPDVLEHHAAPPCWAT